MTRTDHARFDEIYERARDPLARYLARRCAPDAVEDCFQEVMAVAWRRVREVPVGAEVPWLFGVARRTLANHRRAHGRVARLLDRLRLAPAGDALGHLVPVGVDAELATALAALRPEDAELLRLWAWEELAPREIAVALGISANAASIRLHRAKGRLRTLLEAAPSATRKDPGSTGQVIGVEQEKEKAW